MFRIIKWLLKMYIYFYHRVQILGLEHFPQDGAVILVGNHASYLDPIYIVALSPRKVHFMAKQGLFKNVFARFFLKIGGAFEVNREKPDLTTFKTALEYLEKDRVVGLFPEGGIVQDHSFQDIKQGAAYLALKSGAKVVPVYIHGTRKAMKDISVVKPVKIRLRIGKPIDMQCEGSFKQQRLELSNRIQQELIELSKSIVKKKK